MKHAQELGYRTVLVEDASKGISDVEVSEVIKDLKLNNGIVVNSSEVCLNIKFIFNHHHQVRRMVRGEDRRLELGCKLAHECRKRIKYYPRKNKNSRYNL